MYAPCIVCFASIPADFMSVWSGLSVATQMKISVRQYWSRMLCMAAVRSMDTSSYTMICEIRVRPVVRTVWRRKPTERIMIHSDQGSQLTSMDWASFLKQHNLSHRGNYHDNAVAESFLICWSLKEFVTKHTEHEQKQDVPDSIELLYNPQRKNVKNGMLSPVNFERNHELMTKDL